MPVYSVSNSFVSQCYADMGISLWSMISGFIEFVVRVVMAKVAVMALGSEVLYYIEPVAWLGALLFIMLPYYRYQKKLLS